MVPIMGMVFKKVVTRPVPAGAVVTRSRDGTDTAKWTPRGSRRPAVMPVFTLDDGRRVIRQESACYFARYRDPDGLVREVSTRCKDKAAADQALADLERRAERVRSGVMTNREAVAADRMRESLDQHIEDYVERIPGKRGGPSSPVHRINVRSYLRRLAADCGWTCPADLSRDDLERWMNTKARDATEGRSARSINCHRAAVVAFANWLAEPHIGRLPASPFGTGSTVVRKADEEADPRRRRRALTTEELSRLIEAARNAPKRFQTRRRDATDGIHGIAPERLTGEGRGDLYALLAGTGLRVGEVKQLTVADVRLDAAVPHVRITATVAKSRKEQTVPLRADLVELLRRYVADKASSDPVIEVPACLIKRFDADCKRAGIAKRDGDGRTVDVHSLRHTFGTMLSKAGVPPRVAMELMRHSDIRLTMQTYTDPRLFDLAGAVESLPSVAPAAASVAPSPSSGSDPASVAPSVALPDGLSVPFEASYGTDADPSDRTQVLAGKAKRLVF
jgi:integrase